MFGTVLNRFIVQAVAKTPLLIYGSGSQIRGYINIQDTLACISLALENTPTSGDMHIHNQFTEQFSVNQLAKKVQKSLKKIDIDVSINKIKNPRIESEKHYYNASNLKMKKRGLKPTLLTDEVIIDLAMFIKKHIKNINKKIIQPKASW